MKIIENHERLCSIRSHQDHQAPGSCQCSSSWRTNTAINDPAEVVPDDFPIPLDPNLTFRDPKCAGQGAVAPETMDSDQTLEKSDRPGSCGAKQVRPINDIGELRAAASGGIRPLGVQHLGTVHWSKRFKCIQKYRVFRLVVPLTQPVGLTGRGQTENKWTAENFKCWMSIT
jgi:hypothetical protein